MKTIGVYCFIFSNEAVAVMPLNGRERLFYLFPYKSNKFIV